MTKVRVFSVGLGNSDQLEYLQSFQLGDFVAGYRRLEKPFIEFPHDVVVLTDTALVCGTDSEVLQNLKGEQLTPSQQMIGLRSGEMFLGHEAVGTILDSGPQALELGFRPGDRVCICERSTCNAFDITPTCSWCRHGQGIFCEKKSLRSFSQCSYGGFSAVFKRSCWQLFKVDDDLNRFEAASLEPLATSISAVRKVQQMGIKRDGKSNIAVLGGGLFGNLIAQILNLSDYANVSVFETNINRLRLLDFLDVQLHKVKPKSDFWSSFSDKFDIVIDCSGASDTTKIVAEICRAKGVFIPVSFLKGSASSIEWINRKEIMIISTHGYSGASDFSSAQMLLNAGRIKLKKDWYDLQKPDTFVETWRDQLAGQAEHKKSALRLGICFK